MAVPTSALSERVFAGTGTAAPLVIDFQFIDPADLVVSRIVIGEEGETILSRGIDFTVTGGNGGPGSIIPAAAITIGTSWRVRRQTPVGQPATFPSGKYLPAQHEAALDRQAMINQEHARDLARTLKVPFGTAAPNLRIGSAPSTGDILQFDAETNELALTPIAQTQIAELERQAALSVSLAQAVTGPIYLSIASGLTNTDDGDEFIVDNGDGTASIYLNDVGSEVLRRIIIIAPAANGSAAQIGTATGRTVQQMLDGIPTRTMLKQLVPVVGRSVYLTEAGRAGTFICRAGSPPVTDTLEGVFVASSTAGFFWQRQYNGLARAEWFGAVLDDSATDCTAAVQACLDVTKTLYIPRGRYWCANGINGGGCTIRGAGRAYAGLTFTTATAHLLRAVGTISAFVEATDWADFFVARDTNPTTPANPSDDLTQGHGIHLDFVSNARIRNVDTYNNLIEVSVRRTLTTDIRGVRGIRLTGGASDRWRGLYVNGDSTGFIAGFPSPNPSCSIAQINMVAREEVGTSIGFDLQGNLQDLWGSDWESGGFAHIALRLNAQGGNAGDMVLRKVIADGYRTHGFHILNVPRGSSVLIKDSWVAPKVGATGEGIRIEQANGVQWEGIADFSLSPTLRAVYATDSAQNTIKLQVKNCERPFQSISCLNMTAEIVAANTANGTDAGYIVNCIGGGRNRFIVSGRAEGTKQWLDAVIFDASTANNFVDVTGVDGGAAAGARFSIAGTPQTTQGNVSGHVVINPGAGAMA
ncbi:MAG: hypothetical protein ACK4IS_13390 [Erythrobacter sp.]